LLTGPATKKTFDALCSATTDHFTGYISDEDRMKIDLDSDGRNFFVLPFSLNRLGDKCHPSRHFYRWLRKVPEVRRTIKRNREEVLLGATDFTALMIYCVWRPHQLIFSEDAKLAYDFLISKFLHDSKIAKISARFKVHGVCPEMPQGFKEPAKKGLEYTDYQRTAVKLSLDTPALALFMDRGTGKTAIGVGVLCTLARRARRAKKPRMLRALIVCPNQVRSNWSEEIGNFTTNPGKVSIVKGEPVRRNQIILDAYREDAGCEFSAVIVGYDTVPNTIRPLGAIPWDLIILDESHWIKSPTTARYKFCKRLRARKKLILSGTPIANNIMDLWAQLEFLGEGYSGFISYKNFKRFYGEWEQSGTYTGVEKLTGLRNVPLLQERLARLSFSMTKKEAGLKLPPKVYDKYEIEMSERQKKYYIQFRDQLVLEIKEDMQTKKQFMRAENVLTKLLRLAQICSGFVTFPSDDSDGQEVRLIEPIEKNPKILAIKALLAENNEDPDLKTIIWCCFRQDLLNLREFFSRESVHYAEYWGAVSQRKREDSVKRFNLDETCKVFIGNPQSAAEGLNLLGYDPHGRSGQKSYCGHVIYYSQNWSSVLRRQSEDRAHRRGTRRSVRYTDLIAPGTIDDEIRVRVRQKEAMANQVTSINELLEQILGEGVV